MFVVPHLKSFILASFLATSSLAQASTRSPAVTSTPSTSRSTTWSTTSSTITSTTVSTTRSRSVSTSSSTTNYSRNTTSSALPDDCTPTYEVEICTDVSGKVTSSFVTSFPSTCSTFTTTSPSSQTSSHSHFLSTTTTGKDDDKSAEPTSATESVSDSWGKWPAESTGKTITSTRTGNIWDDEDPKPSSTPTDVEHTWSAWTSSTADPTTTTAHWGNWPGAQPSGSQAPNVVTITLTTTFKVPCSTGWETKTTTILTTHCGCKETPVPTIPAMTTYTTQVPDRWGIGKTVTVTVPVTVYTDGPASTPAADNVGNGKISSSLVVVVRPTPAAADPSSTWATWDSDTADKTPDAAAASSTWAAWTGAGSDSDSADKTSAAATGSSDPSSTWAAWSSAETPAAATGSTGNGAYDAQSTGYKGVAAYTGAASTISGNFFVVLAGAVAAIALLL